MRDLPILALFLAITVGGGIAIGILTPPGPWYAGLEKPFFNPPGWLFAPVWTVLYICIAIAGWRILRLAPRSRAMRLWVLQLVLNFLWSPIVFGLHRLDLGLVVILALLAGILAFIARARGIDRPSAWLFTPYAAWVAFASLLNAALFLLN
ncbi:MAG: tryptophan-rich sensory protein [Pseudooceanicola sp.]|nr:tryptophan-rich sensory protein [Pseudooceanicola sp.]